VQYFRVCPPCLAVARQGGGGGRHQHHVFRVLAQRITYTFALFRVHPTRSLASSRLRVKEKIEGNILQRCRGWIGKFILHDYQFYFVCTNFEYVHLASLSRGKVEGESAVGFSNMGNWISKVKLYRNKKTEQAPNKYRTNSYLAAINSTPHKYPTSTPQVCGLGILSFVD